MVFNANITRADAAALIPEEVSDVLLGDIVGSNPLLQLARRLPDMPRNQTRMPVLGSLATAYFVQGDTGLKRTTEISWENRFIDAAEIAAIVPVPENVLADADYDIWGQIRPELVTAFNVALTEAVLYGTNIPATWTTNLGSAGLVAGAIAAVHNPSIAAFPDVYDAILAESAVGNNDGLWAVIEDDGYNVTGNVATIQMRTRLRGLRDLNGQPIFQASVQGPARYELEGTPLFFPNDGTMDPTQALMISGQWDQLVWALRSDMTFKMLDQAVIQDSAGNIIFNLPQQDMVALRAVMRIGFALPNPINRVNPNAATRYPFGILTA